MAIGRKTGGKIKGVSKHKPKPIILAPTDENRALALMAPTAEVRTPKAVMLSAMLKFERMSDVLMSKAERLTKAHAKPEGIAKLVAEAHRFTVAAVQCAEKVAPYIHARLLAVESRGDMTEDKAPYVVRVPTVMTSSADWQTAVGAALIEAAASQPDNGPLQASLPHPAKSQPADPEGPPVPASVVLRADQKGRISTVMPAVPKVVQPAGTQEWLDSVAASRKAG